MYRRNISLTPLAGACQIGVLLLVLLAVAGLLVHTIAVERRPEQVVGTKQNAR
jgi:hypothetical protein